MFGIIEKPQFGYNPISEQGGLNADMLMRTGYILLQPGQSFDFFSETDEIAVLLLSGTVDFLWEGNIAAADRPNSFDYNPWCLHLSKGTQGSIVARSEAELFLQQTENARSFASVFYKPEDTMAALAGRDTMQGCAQRSIRTVFDYSSAPYSNLVVGEVVNYPGRWSSYPPHHHPQPELYFYRFDKPQGFGACFIGENIYKTQHLSYASIPGGPVHPQSAAPGYALHYVWVIRHLDGDPWIKTRIDDPDHEWLLSPDAKIWNEQGGAK